MICRLAAGSYALTINKLERIKKMGFKRSGRRLRTLTKAQREGMKANRVLNE